MSITITSGGSTSTGTFTFQDGNVDYIKSTQTNEIDVVSGPGRNADYAYGNDVNGVIEKITISGTITTATSTRVSAQTITSVSQQIGWLKGLSDGNQLPHTLNTDYETSRHVLIETFEYNQRAGELTAEYTINMVVVV